MMSYWCQIVIYMYALILYILNKFPDTSKLSYWDTTYIPASFNTNNNIREDTREDGGGGGGF